MDSASGVKCVWLAALALCAGCARGPRVQVVTPYAGETLPARVRVESVNATGRELPLPPAGFFEQAVRVLTRRSDPQASVTDAFRHAASERIRDMGVEASLFGGTHIPRFLVTLRVWEVRDGEATGAVVVASADYQLLDTAGHALWAARVERQLVRLSGPNLSTYDVGRVARTCAELGLASLKAGKNLP